MIFYHGLPITPNHVCKEIIKGSHVMVSYYRPEQLQIALDVCNGIAIDNGAFSYWKAGEKIYSWNDYYEFVSLIVDNNKFHFAIIPDVINGTANENDKLLDKWPFGPDHGAPVWHLHEPISRLLYICNYWNVVCFGSSGEYSCIGTRKWWSRMYEAMNCLYERGMLKNKFHGLRMMNKKVIRIFPFNSVDSSTIGRNINLDCKWPKGQIDKVTRGLIMKSKIENAITSTDWKPRYFQTSLLSKELV